MSAETQQCCILHHACILLQQGRYICCNMQLTYLGKGQSKGIRGYWVEFVVALLVEDPAKGTAKLVMKHFVVTRAC